MGEVNSKELRRGDTETRSFSLQYLNGLLVILDKRLKEPIFISEHRDH